MPSNRPKPLFDVNDRVGIVTGAGTGIGRAIAVGLAEAGMRIVLCDVEAAALRETAAAIDAGGGKALAVDCDVSSPSDVARLAQTVHDAFGRLDALVNNAALARLDEERAFLELDEAIWDRTLAVNLKGAFLCCKAAAAIMASGSGGTIVNVTSQLARVAIPNRSAYIASKGGLEAFTRALAVDLAPYSIRVNALAPGPVYTRRTAPLMDRAEWLEQNRTRLLAGRPGDPGDFVGAALYLCSDASAFVSGSTLVVDGGYLST